jgi:hypothetical protein
MISFKSQDRRQTAAPVSRRPARARCVDAVQPHADLFGPAQYSQRVPVRYGDDPALKGLSQCREAEGQRERQRNTNAHHRLWNWSALLQEFGHFHNSDIGILTNLQQMLIAR